MSALNPTPMSHLLDAQGRPYFLWDADMTLERFTEALNEDSTARPYLIAKLMRQAKPDDVFSFVTLSRIRADWPRIEPMLGHSRPFWTWLLAQWERQGIG